MKQMKKVTNLLLIGGGAAVMIMGVISVIVVRVLS